MSKTSQEQIEDILKKTDRLKTADAPEGNPFFPGSLSIEEASAKINKLLIEARIYEVDRLQRLMGDCYDGHNDLFNKRLSTLQANLKGDINE